MSLRINKYFWKFQQKVLMKLGDIYFEVENTTASGPPNPWFTYLLIKPVLKNKFVKMLRIFYIEIDIL